MATEPTPNGTSTVSRRKKNKVIPARLIPKVRSPLQQLGDSNIIGITFSRKDGQIVDANDEFLRMVGYSRQDLEAGRLNWAGMTPPEWAKADQEAASNFAATGRVSTFEKEYLHRDGTRVPVLVGIIALHGAELDALAFIVDMTERRRAETELRRSEERYRRIVENTHEGICVYDSDHNVTYCNRRLVNMLGYKDADSQLTRDAIHFGEDREEVDRRFERRRSGTSESYDKLGQHIGQPGLRR
jgi:PAS domain S-box-containing protein